MSRLVLLLGCLFLMGSDNFTILESVSFTTAKKRAAEIHADRQTTVYCGCAYNDDNQIDAASCGYSPRVPVTSTGKLNVRTTRVEWEHLVPASRFGQMRICWNEREKYPDCRKSDGGLLSGRACCRRVDPVFQAMEGDLNNLWPAVGELNADRSDKEPLELEGEPREYGKCDFETSSDFFEPAPSTRGAVARAYLYFWQTWGMELTDAERTRFMEWNLADPPTDWELERDGRVRMVQHVGNNWIADHPYAFCTPREKCCRVCSSSKACGDSCISATKSCTKTEGCACNAADVCP